METLKRKQKDESKNLSTPFFPEYRNRNCADVPPPSCSVIYRVRCSATTAQETLGQEIDHKLLRLGSLATTATPMQADTSFYTRVASQNIDSRRVY
ncbi:hypothetical protein CC1G_13785 [Coprinopsis cinerea okayama7|uniref:Uncharacterized protein n=1 Tax=Coprinopsis cinerea (strain Okayama-7 / 130 / ATCC MYA-4618 / FGSC 9003) TaxID=240176 RepID=D6RK92_COPC7|nr:hypothetical protein CC1G_13785 [Coprinopsis cinerea okayama7\|eukprot:XP_002912253.1 hypothetical protein CC1G_13785 [Coprinopsis cinerea okayama7\